MQPASRHSPNKKLQNYGIIGPIPVKQYFLFIVRNSPYYLKVHRRSNSRLVNPSPKCKESHNSGNIRHFRRMTRPYYHQHKLVGLRHISPKWQDLFILEVDLITFPRRKLKNQPKNHQKRPKNCTFFYRIFAGKMKIFAGKAFAGKKQFLPANIFAVLTPIH